MKIIKSHGLRKVEYKKEDIQRYDEQADLFIKEAKKLLEDKNNKLENNTKN